MFIELVQFHSSDHAHDSEDGSFLAPGQPDAFANRVFIRPVSLREFPVHDDRVQAGHPPLAVRETAEVAFAQVSAVVLLRERAAVKQRNAHGTEVFRAH